MNSESTYRMRPKRAVILLVTISAVFFAAFYVCGKKSAAVEIERDQMERQSSGFYISDTPPEWNYWDVAAVGNFVLASASFVAGVWSSRRN